MDEFLKVIYMNYMEEKNMGDDFFKYFKEFTDKMHDTFSEKAYEDFITAFLIVQLKTMNITLSRA